MKRKTPSFNLGVENGLSRAYKKPFREPKLWQIHSLILMGGCSFHQGLEMVDMLIDTATPMGLTYATPPNRSPSLLSFCSPKVFDILGRRWTPALIPSTPQLHHLRLIWRGHSSHRSHGEGSSASATVGASGRGREKNVERLWLASKISYPQRTKTC